MSDPATKASAKAEVGRLVAAFQRNQPDYLRANYNETQARTEFITPLLRAFGWDVHNTRGYQLALREVIEEATVEVGDERVHKKPDYELRLSRQRKLFVEAKKPSIRIESETQGPFQVRRYGFSASLPISVLTNFRHLAIYDCQTAPQDTDAANVSRRLLLSSDEFEARFDELWPLLSREAVYSGEFDQQFQVASTRRGAEQFDDVFLEQIRRWRAWLAIDIRENTPVLTTEELNYVVQRFLSRIIFLRICEDRDIAKYETLRDLDGCGVFKALMDELRRADQFYDSGLFRLVDDTRLGVHIGDTAISSIIRELYYPTSPYTFAVVEPEILGEIYEQFLGDAIETEGQRVNIVSKPEVREGGGVIPTPRYIAYSIVERTLRPLLEGRSPTDLEHFTVADICCGSGNFLLAAFEILLDHYLTWYLNHERSDHEGQRVYMGPANQWRLTLEERRRILVTHIRGVDIDPSAVEITQFSLLLKLIEGETFDALNEYVTRAQTPALPGLDSTIRRGNSLVSLPEWRAALSEEPTDDQIKPFSWEAEFPDEMCRGGFDAIVGNPPYIRIQNMAKYSPDEVRFFQRPDSPYTTAEHHNFDKYFLFIERSIGLAKLSGRVGMIVPHKFATIQSGRALRRLIATGRLLSEMVHFGAKQVFGADAANYTCILILDRRTAQEVRLERPERLESWRYGAMGSVDVLPADELGEGPWQFADAETRALFGRIKENFRHRLGTLAEIFVGVQTSADDVYIFQAVAEDAERAPFTGIIVIGESNGASSVPSLHDVRICQFARALGQTPGLSFRIILSANWRGNGDERISFNRSIWPDRFPVCWDYLNSRRLELESAQHHGRNRRGAPVVPIRSFAESFEV